MVCITINVIHWIIVCQCAFYDANGQLKRLVSTQSVCQVEIHAQTITKFLGSQEFHLLLSCHSLEQQNRSQVVT